MMGRSGVRGFISEHSGALPRSADEILGDFDILQRLLEKWQRIQNLVSRETPGDYWSRHFHDSLGLLPLLNGALVINDLGSGGGFPALPLAIVLKGSKAE